MSRWTKVGSEAQTGALVAGASLVGGILYATKIQPTRVEICSRSILLPRLDREFDGYRVALISDIHMDGWMNLERLETAIELLNEQQPDMVAITADYVTDTVM